MLTSDAETGVRGAKPAVQTRSQETRDKLIAALDGLLQERDFATITVAEIAARAGVSVASIYQRFGNRKAAVSILIELYLLRVTSWATASPNRPDTGGLTLRAALERVAVSAWQQFEELRYVMAPAYLQSRLHPEQLGDHWRETEALAEQGFRQLLAAHEVEIDHPDLDRAAAMIAYLYNMMFLGRLLHPGGMASWDLPTTAEGFAAEVADLACGYLRARATPEPGPRP
jgi:AcrR family transcriptional regulator